MSAYKWLATKYPGVWYREHYKRKMPKSSLKDRYYCICYRYCGKVKWEAIGWQSQGATLENAVKILATVKAAIREGREFKSLREKREEAKAARLEKERGLKTVAGYWNEIYRPKIKSAYKENSFIRVESIFRKWLIRLFGGITITAIDIRHWDILREAMTKAGLSQRTKEYVAGEFRRMLKDAGERGVRVQAPPSGKQIGITAPKNNRRERVITSEEGAMIMEALKKLDMEAFYITKFAFLTGCRFSECAGLKWENCGESTITFTNTKNKSSRRLSVTSGIKELINDIKPEKPLGYVFISKKGTPYAQPPKAFKKAVERLGLNTGRDRLDRITFHSIRHSVATKLAGILDIRSLMDFMGWKRIEMAARYIHGNENKIKNASETLRELFKG